MKTEYLLKPHPDGCHLIVNKETNQALLFDEIVSKLNRHYEMYEALTKAEKILLEVHQYGLIGGLKDSYISTMENIQSLLKDIKS